MLPLYQLQLDITNACNLRCIHCRVPEDTRARQDIPLPLFLNAIDQARELGAEDLLLSGGEPLLRDDWFDMAQHARSIGYQTVTFLTNGVQVTEETPARLQTAGVTEVQVSLDGPTPAINDHFRGQAGAFEAATRAVRLLASAELATAITMTVTNFNYAYAREMATLARQLGAAQLTFRRFVPQGYGLIQGQQLAITPAQVRALLKLHAELVKEYGDALVISLALFPFAIMRDPQVLEEYREQIAQGPCGGCSAGIIGLYVDPLGVIMPCPHLHLTLGHLASDPLADIWSAHPIVQQLRDRTHLGGACGTCRFVNVCGGCRAYPLATLGELLGADTLCPRNGKRTGG